MPVINDNTPVIVGIGFAQVTSDDPQLRKFGEMTAEANQKAAEPEYLASVIYQALTDKNPKTAYSVKADPQRSFLEWLPIKVADGIFKNLLKQS